MNSSENRNGILPRHVNVTGRPTMFLYERCEDRDCLVGVDGIASCCGRIACPGCGSGGANLTATGERESGAGTRRRVECSCGNAWHLPAASTPRPRRAGSSSAVFRRSGTASHR